MTERLEDRDLLTGRTAFLADVPFEGLEAVFVRSYLAHGQLVSVDAVAAEAMPGVVAVATADSLGVGPFTHFEGLNPHHARHPLALGRVRHVGEAVAVVLAETRAQAEDAAELVEVDIDPLDPVVNPGQPAPLLYEASGTNEVHRLSAEGEPDEAAGPEMVVGLEVVNPKVASAPIEPDGIIVEPGADGRLSIWCTSQGVHEFRTTIARALGLEPEHVHLRSPAVGGAFGGRASPPVEFVVISALARELGQPIRWLQDRTENLLCMPQGRGVISRLRLGLSQDGIFSRLDVDAVADAGATAHMAGLLMVSIRRQAVGLYRIERLRWQGQAMLTTTTPVGAYRGAGQPEANHARERVIDVAARRLGLDPIELRRRNLLWSDELPRQQPGGVTYDEADPLGALEEAVRRADVDRWRAKQAAARSDGSPRLIGIGIACYAQTSGRGSPADSAIVRIDADGRALVACGSASHGQSHASTWRDLVAQQLQIEPSLVQIVDADTDAVPDGLTTGGSRASQVLASVISSTCDDIIEGARTVAAGLLEVAPADLVVEPAGYGLAGGLAVVGVPTRRITWAEAAQESPNHCLEAARSESVEGEAHPYGTHVTVVEVDTETGSITVLNHTAVDDCGTVLQPVFVEGQQHGGSVAGLGQAIFECVSYDADGNPETGNFMSYLLPSAADVSSIDAHTRSTPTSRNPLGTRGIGENGCNAATPSAHNAVMDALAPLGIEHIDLPLTPERVWNAVQRARTMGRSGL